MPEITRYNDESLYPSEIDPLLFLQDINMNQIQIPREHEELLANEEYTNAGIYIESSEVDSMCASLFRLLENRIYATQDHILSKHTKWYEVHGVESPIECFAEPTDKTQKPVWTNIKDLSRVNLGGLSSSYSLSIAGGFRP